MNYIEKLFMNTFGCKVRDTNSENFWDLKNKDVSVINIVNNYNSHESCFECIIYEKNNAWGLARLTIL